MGGNVILAGEKGQQALFDGFGDQCFRGTKFLSAAWARVILRRMSDVTHILSAIEHGDPHAAEQLLPLVYDELRKLAALQLAHDRPGETLNPTVLVHDHFP